MSDISLRESAGTGIRSPSGPAFRVGHGLHLAAAPTFALMALLTGVLGGGQPDMFCSAMQNTSSLGGMIPMYLLMTAFHLPPWLKVIFGPRFH